ncbi:MAG: aminotransferase class V-fold PLP-dependent enzyme [Phycisphaerales bacterium JB065]
MASELTGASSERVYFDNAATSFPKPASVVRAMTDYATRLGASPGRGAYREAQESAQILSRCREAIRKLLNARSAEHVIFTLNTTDALNLAIKGLLLPRLATGESVHVVTTAMDHNSVLRPLNALISQFDGLLTQTIVEADSQTGLVDPEAVRRAIRPDTRLVAVVHASNVTGSLQPIAAIGAVCRAMAVPLLVDAAQSAGHIPVDMQGMNIDLLAAPGHKGLLGPLGTGVLVMRPGMERMIHTTREGGTGSISEQPIHPLEMPDKYESGSHNTMGIAGLLAGVEYLLERGMDDLARHERELSEQFLRGIHDSSGHLLPGLRLLGPPGVADRVGVFAVTVDGMSPLELAQELESRFGVLTRPGLHCAPHAHETMRTDPESVGAEMAGACRFSLGPFLSVQDVKYATDALAQICEEQAAKAATV